MSERLPLIAITMGDPAGIGPEIVVRALGHREVFEACRPVVIGNRGVMEAAVKGLASPVRIQPVTAPDAGTASPDAIALLDLPNVDVDRLEKAKPSAAAGAAAYEYVARAISLARANVVDAIVTAPINKDSLNKAGHKYAGHTEILADHTGTRDYAMMLASETLRVVLVTIHVSLEEAIGQIDEARILRAIRLAAEAGRMMGIAQPRIAVAGLNPHAGEGGLFGRHEIEIIEPAVRKAKDQGHRVCGPLPADTLFFRACNREYDFVVAMYHDQGLIPIKLVGFGKAVNVTLGLPIIRTSVDHGTAFGKAWQFRAREDSLLEAIRVAVEFARFRRQEREVRAGNDGRAGA